MLKINIRDKTFSGTIAHPFLLENQKIEWVRDNVSVSNSCFITDMCLPDIKKARGIKRSIAWLLEPKAIHPFTYDFIKQNNKLYDYVLTFDKDLIDLGQNYIFYAFGGSWIQNTMPINKSKLCSTITSKKCTTIGHQMRHQVGRVFKNEIDLYGEAFKSIKDKDEALAPYYFSITIENSQQDYYFTEKLIDCFITKSIPIYWGCPSIGKFFNTDGMIIFRNLDELNGIIKHISIEQYQKMLPAIEDNYIRAQKHLIPENWILENLGFLMN